MAKKALRAGGGEAEVASILLRAVALKPTGHRLDEGLSTRARSMFQIRGLTVGTPTCRATRLTDG